MALASLSPTRRGCLSWVIIATSICSYWNMRIDDIFFLLISFAAKCEPELLSFDTYTLKSVFLAYLKFPFPSNFPIQYTSYPKTLPYCGSEGALGIFWSGVRGCDYGSWIEVWSVLISSSVSKCERASVGSFLWKTPNWYDSCISSDWAKWS